MNNKLYWLLGLFFLSQISPVFGQIDSTHLSSDFLKNYVPPNYDNHRFFLNPQLSESIVRSDALDRNRIAGSLYGFYLFNAQKDQSDTELTSSINTGFLADERNDVRPDGDNIYYANLYFELNKYFYISGKAFISAGARVESENRFFYLAENRNSFRQNLSVPISIGFGRPFRVNDAWRAMTIFNDLECYGIAADRSQTKEVADLISRQRNTLFLDNRLGAIQNRTELLNYLNDNDIVNLSALSATVINDSYRFENFYNRYSGYRIRGGVIPRVTQFSFGDGTPSQVTDSELALDPFFNFEYYLPISEDWQLDIVSFSIYQSQEFAERNMFRTNNYISLAWIPSLRTRLTSGLSFNAVNNELTFSSEEIGLTLTYNYYLSQAVQWRTSLFFSHTWEEILGNKNTYFDQAFSIGFSYIWI